MYPSDFEAADAVFTPQDDSPFLGLPPLMALILFLLLLAIAAGMFFFGRWHAEQSDGNDADRAPDDIHRAILHASVAAMAASSDELKSRAKALRTTIDDHLGPVLEVGKGVNGPVRDLDAALKGEIKETPKADDKGHGHDHDHAHPAAPAGVPPVTVNQIFVGGTTPPPHPPHGSHDDGHKPDKPKHEPKPETRPMTGPEQIEALSRAVRAFHDHWSRGPERIRELREARRALSRRPSSAALRAPGGRVRDQSRSR
ncbi:hypothetical protein [Brevundimonas sp.]|uniref:hypothetical protein n=1 Tax=Brevundimonas sp. TaxID=1871086 RepID=UPI00286CDD32|nr:hypothetical protein [Brevundimonas sp.]